MKIKRYIAPDMRQALKQVRLEQGPDAVILSSRRVSGGLEVVAAVDYDADLVNSAVDRAERKGRQTSPASEPAGSESAADGLGDTGNDRAPIDELLAADERQRPPSARPSTRRSGDARSEARIVWSQEPTLVSMRAEINQLRRMLEGQLSSLAWNDLARRSPARAALLRQLIHMGLAPDLAQDLANDLPEPADDFARCWRQALGLLAQKLPIAEVDPLDQAGVIALVGATGVGKTTTLAKLAARYARRHGPESVALISADDYRVGAQEQLFTFGRMLNIPVYVATTAAQLRERIERLRHARLVLLDTAGIGQRDVRFERSIEALEGAGRPLLPYLVLSANAQRPALDESIEAFGRLPLAGCVVTKLDEAASLGGLLSVVVRHGLSIAYSTDGQEVPEHLRRASARNLVRRAHELASSTDDEMEDEVFAQHVNGTAAYACS